MKIEDFKKFAKNIEAINKFIENFDFTGKNFDFYYFLQRDYKKKDFAQKMVYILNDGYEVHVFFDEKKAYTVPWNRFVEEDIDKKNMATVNRYREAYIDNPQLKQLTLGQLIEKLKQQPENNVVEFDMRDSIGIPFNPLEFGSWRGDYSQLGLEYNSKPITVKNFLKIAEGACDTHFIGYKGGEYFMDPHTPIWVSPYGISVSNMLIGVKQEGSKTILTTEMLG